MARVTFSVEEDELEGDEGGTVLGLILTCHQCGHSVEVFGVEDVSVRRGAVMLRDECPMGGKNFYVAG